jgi:hypothetical protein
MFLQLTAAKKPEPSTTDSGLDDFMSRFGMEDPFATPATPRQINFEGMEPSEEPKTEEPATEEPKAEVQVPEAPAEPEKEPEAKEETEE